MATADLHLAELAAALALPTVPESDEVMASVASQLVESEAAKSARLDSAPSEAAGLGLEVIYRVLVSKSCLHLLDPLHTLPSLLPSPEPAVDDLIQALGEHASAREVVMAMLEALERLSVVKDDSDEEDEENGDVNGARKLTRLFSLAELTVPRLRSRRKTPGATLAPLIEAFRSAVGAVSVSSTEEGKMLVRGAAKLSLCCIHWAEDALCRGDDDAAYKQGLEEVKNVVRPLLLTTLSSPHLVDAMSVDNSGQSLTQMTYERVYPRRARAHAPPNPGSSADRKSCNDDTTHLALEAARLLTCLPLQADDMKSIPSLVLFTLAVTSDSQASPSLEPALGQLADLKPETHSVILASMRGNVALDYSLSLLLLWSASSNIAAVLPDSSRAPPPEAILPLVSILPPLCTLHPSAPIRLVAHAVLSILVADLPGAYQILVLKDLVQEDEDDTLGISVIGVGLVREALLRGLGPAPQQVDPAELMREVSPLLFRAALPTPLPSLDAFLEGSIRTNEVGRIVECLGVYYLALRRDTQNVTGVRSLQHAKRVENEFLRPLESAIEQWTLEEADVEESEDNHFSALVPLQIALERANEALGELGLECT